MSKFLVIAEKPSVAQSYAKNLSAYKREDGYLEGESCIVSWCLGHLAEYAQPEEYDPKYEKWQFDDLPILPEAWKLKVSKDKKKQFDVLKGLMNRSDVEYLVNGCDAGREGELIFQRVYVLAGCRKPVKRLWISSMEDAAIQKGFQTMKSEEEYKNLCMAAVCRAQADCISLEKIIQKCTQKSPDRRYDSMESLLIDLRKALLNPNEDFVILGSELNAVTTEALNAFFRLKANGYHFAGDDAGLDDYALQFTPINAQYHNIERFVQCHVRSMPGNFVLTKDLYDVFQNCLDFNCDVFKDVTGFSQALNNYLLSNGYVVKKVKKHQGNGYEGIAISNP